MNLIKIIVFCSIILICFQRERNTFITAVVVSENLVNSKEFYTAVKEQNSDIFIVIQADMNEAAGT